MIRTFEKECRGQRWNEVVIVDTVTNHFQQFCYEIINGKLLKFSESIVTPESKYPIDCTYWIKNNCQWFNYIEVEVDFLDKYPLWNPATDLTPEIKKEYQVY